MQGRAITAKAIAEFKEHLILEERSVATIQKYIRDVKAFMAYAQNSAITKETVIAYKKYLQENYAVRSVNSMLASINSFFSFFGWNDLKVKSLKLQQQVFCPEEKELTKAEYARLCKTAERKHNHRLNLILQTICGTGIRVSELQFITVEAVKNGEAVVNCKAKTRSVFIVKELKQKLLRYAASTKSDFMQAEDKFKSISGFRDADLLAENCRKEVIYLFAKRKMNGIWIDQIEAIKDFERISGFKDADELIISCQKKIEEMKAKEEAERLEAARKAEKAAEKRKKAFAIGTPIVCAVIAFIIVLNTVIIPNGTYNSAVSLMQKGEYEEAIAAFEAMDGYKDNEEQIVVCKTAIKDSTYADAVALMDEGKYDEAIAAFEATDGYKDSEDQIENCKTEKLKVAGVVDIVFFGAYEQDNNTSNGKEDIEWLVLEVKDGKALVISKYVLDCKPYNTSFTGVTWETCTLRKWLNNDFINEAFSADEKAVIPTVTVSADKNPDYSTNPGNATQDQVFLLSITEANQYFSSDSARQCEPTDYAVANGAYVNSDNGNCWWWLRSPGSNPYNAADVYLDGDVDEYGSNVNLGNYAVRPALWIDLNS